MKLRRNSIKIAIYSLFTLLWMTLFINTSENKTKKNITKPRFSILNPEPSILTSELNPEPSNLTSKPLVINTEFFFLNSQPSILNDSEDIIPDFDNVITPKIKQFENETKLHWFNNLDQRDKDNVTTRLSQSIKRYNGLNQDILMDMEITFGIIPVQTQQLYEFLYLKEKKTSKDWFDNPNYLNKDISLQLVKQRMEHYEKINEDVVKDMKQKFGAIASLTQELYKFLYLKEKIRLMTNPGKENQNQIDEEYVSKPKNEFENYKVLNKKNDDEDIDFNTLELNETDDKANTIPIFPIKSQEPKRKMEYLLIEVSEEQNMELNLFSEYSQDVVELPGKDDDGYCHTTYSDNNISMVHQNIMCFKTCSHYDFHEVLLEHGADAIPLDRIERDTKKYRKKSEELFTTRHSISMTLIIDNVKRKCGVTPPEVSFVEGMSKISHDSYIQTEEGIFTHENYDVNIWEQYVLSHNKRDVDYVLSAANYLKINCLSQWMGAELAQEIQNKSRKEDVFALLAGKTLVYDFLKN